MTLTTEMTAQQNDKVSKAVKEQSKKLFSFIRRQVPDAETAEDLMRDVFYQMTSTVRSEEIERAGAWLFRVARNRITDWYRKKKSESLDAQLSRHNDEDEEVGGMDLISRAMFQEAKTPEEEYARQSFWQQLEEALEELPAEQREAFEMNELEGMQFKEMSEILGLPVNTLISRKRYAVLYLRDKLKEMYEEIIGQ